ncbi:hypothetical protein LTR53_017250, partial [Teratosphaeriaceae sp. CCFEE 6253]
KKSSKSSSKDKDKSKKKSPSKGKVKGMVESFEGLGIQMPPPPPLLPELDDMPVEIVPPPPPASISVVNVPEEGDPIEVILASGPALESIEASDPASIEESSALSPGNSIGDSKDEPELVAGHDENAELFDEPVAAAKTRDSSETGAMVMPVTPVHCSDDDHSDADASSSSLTDAVKEADEQEPHDQRLADDAVKDGQPSEELESALAVDHTQIKPAHDAVSEAEAETIEEDLASQGASDGDEVLQGSPDTADEPLVADQATDADGADESQDVLDGGPGDAGGTPASGSNPLLDDATSDVGAGDHVDGESENDVVPSDVNEDIDPAENYLPGIVEPEHAEDLPHEPGMQESEANLTEADDGDVMTGTGAAECHDTELAKAEDDSTRDAEPDDSAAVGLLDATGTNAGIAPEDVAATDPTRAPSPQTPLEVVAETPVDPPDAESNEQRMQDSTIEVHDETVPSENVPPGVEAPSELPVEEAEPDANPTVETQDPPAEPQATPEPVPVAPPSPTLSKDSSHRHRADHWERKHTTKPSSSDAKPMAPSSSKRSSRHSKEEPKSPDRPQRSRRHSTSVEDDAERRRRREVRKADEVARVREEERRQAEEEVQRRVRHEARRAARKAETLAREEAEAAERKGAEARRKRHEEREAVREAARPPRARRESVTKTPLFFRTSGDRPRERKGDERGTRSSRHGDRPASRRSPSPPPSGPKEDAPPDVLNEEAAPASPSSSKAHHRRRERPDDERPRASRTESERHNRRPALEEKPRSFFGLLLRRL